MFTIRGARSLIRTPAGDLHIQATEARPGHERVGFFRLGPSTFVDLTGVSVVCKDQENREVFRATARSGRLVDGKLEMRHGTILETPLRSALTPDKLTIDLTRGSFRAH